MKKSKVSDLVRELIEAKPFLVDGLKEDIINHSALARKLYPEVRAQIKGCSMEAIVIAIRRYAEGIEKEPYGENILKALAGSAFSLKGGLVRITLKKNPNSLTVLNTQLQDVRWAEGETMYLVQGQVETGVIADQQIAERLKDQLRPGILYYQTDVHALSIRTSLPGAETPGLYYYLFGILERSGISVEEVISTPNEILLILSKSDAHRAYELVSSTAATCRKTKNPT
ncbi:MAG: hypothetical protein ABH829_00120 [archaeon]